MKTTCEHGHTFEKSSDCPTCPTCENERASHSGFPKIGAPATRALQNAEVQDIAELRSWTENDLGKLHGMGPKALELLRAELAAQGLAFK